ncbi:MAG TPA: PadR family transcriptional regulator [Nitrososphaerales archaeon]|nr:PadR family transcriptional regulator [Nitrososphaerales archaeon]
MSTPFPRHWTHPQAIPRGFLRIYILTTLSRAPATGYEIMQRIDERTEGAWRPGPGTIYPLLKTLVGEKMVTSSGKKSKTSRVTYTITAAAKREIKSMYAGMATFGRKERVMMRLVSDLMPNSALVPILLNRAREGSEFLRSRIAELPEPERRSAMRELRSITENQLDWIKSVLEPTGTLERPRKPLR